MMRSCGMFLHITSLPSPYGIGTLGREAYDFVDFLSRCGQKIWQILPVGPVSGADFYSPYMPLSAFAGNPLLIDLDLLVGEGCLEKGDLNGLDFGSGPFTDYRKVEETRRLLFEKAFRNGGRILDSGDFEAFRSQNAFWLRDYADFMAGRSADGPALYHEFLQYLFFRQWHALKQYANGKGIRIFGDMPIYVSAGGADLAYNSELFLLDGQKRPVLVAGVPPDAFSREGQKWGNPLYDWAKLKETGYRWWISRIRQALTLFDIVKIDHFRAFDEFYAIPADAPDAADGTWMPGPKEDFFLRLKSEIPNAAIVAEDLGLITESVERLLRSTGFPGMKVLQFAFGTGSGNPYLPHNHVKNCVVYTGTHDNNTVKGWLDTVNRNEFSFAVQYLRLNSYEKYTEGMIRAALGSVADTAVIPLADWLDLGEYARMNTPGTTKNNWVFRISKNEIASPELAGKIAYLTGLYGR